MPPRGTGRVDVYQDGDGEGHYRWRATAANGRIVADSGQSYTRRQDAERAARALFGASVRQWNLRIEYVDVSPDGEMVTYSYVYEVIGGPVERATFGNTTGPVI